MPRKKLGEEAFPVDRIDVIRKNNLPDSMAFLNRRRGRWPKWVMINDELYKKITYNRGQDLISLWRVSDGQYVTFPYTETQKRTKPVFYTPEVAAMLNRHRVTIVHIMHQGAFPVPQRAWPEHMKVEDRNPKITTARLLWSEKDIMLAHEYFANQKNYERKNKEIVKNAVRSMPNKREMTALINTRNVTYTKTKDGEFIPMWKAPDF